MTKKIPAFALLEVSLALLILGILLGTTFPLIEHISTLNTRLKTEQAIQQALRTLGQYVRKKGALPCPLDPLGRIQTECPGNSSGLFPWEEVMVQPSLSLSYTMTGDLSAQTLHISQAQNKSDAYAKGEPFNPLFAFCSVHSEGLKDGEKKGENDFIALSLSAPGMEPIWVSRNNLIALYGGSYC